LRVLVVDDELSNINEIKDMILKTGKNIDVVYSTNPLNALEILEKEKFDAGFFDISMPAMSGLELAQRIPKHNNDLDVVFITAYNNYASEAFEVNAIDYILKPLRYERFVKTLNKVFRKDRASVKKDEELILRVLGIVNLSYGNVEMKWNRRKTYELFYFLILNKGKKVHKHTICKEIWPNLDEERALSNLQVTMCRLRKDLSGFSGEKIYIEYIQDYYILHSVGLTIDIDDFILLSKKEDIIPLEKAFKIYSGELFSMENWQWAIEAREFYRKEFEKITIKLIENYRLKGYYQKIIQLIEKYIPIGLPNELISIYYLETINHGEDRKRNGEIALAIQEWYKKELDMPLPKEIKNIVKRWS